MKLEETGAVRRQIISLLTSISGANARLLRSY
jgi:hypothetical protein